MCLKRWGKLRTGRLNSGAKTRFFGALQFGVARSDAFRRWAGLGADDLLVRSDSGVVYSALDTWHYGNRRVCRLARVLGLSHWRTGHKT
jgi:hypothetical protein